MHALGYAAKVLCQVEARSTILILSDSLWAIQILKGEFRSKKSKALCHSAVSQFNLLCSKHDVTLAWVPGHVGVDGNEKADRLADEAVRKNRPDTVNIVQHPDSFYDKSAEDFLDPGILDQLREVVTRDDALSIDDDDWTRSGRASVLPSSESESDDGAEVDALKPSEDDLFEIRIAEEVQVQNCRRRKKKKKRRNNNCPRFANISTRVPDDDLLEFLDSQISNKEHNTQILISSEDDVLSSDDDTYNEDEVTLIRKTRTRYCREILSPPSSQEEEENPFEDFDLGSPWTIDFRDTG